MIAWLLDTALWTGALIALVLILRRPVARHFGARMAYALWALPAVRLILPPIVLPASLAPQAAVTSPVAVAPAAVADPDAFAAELTTAVPEVPAAPIFDTDLLVMLALGIWLAGALVFLLRRFVAYHDMRDELLTGARAVGTIGTVRLVETQATHSPVAFGIRDKVIALPQGFLAHHDSEMRDLAMAHEMAHHHGRDLFVNMAIQPLFALHWFNPLAHFGWLALRRDQEAACDARVLECRPSEARATYARTIASFAAGPNVALAAPMACPVLGEKSIIERLRSLNMNEMSARRRMAGRLMMGAALVALPLTASVSYAEAQAPDVPEAPQAPEPPMPPAPPAAPLPPEAPEAPPAPEFEREFDAQVWSTTEEEEESADGMHKKVRVVRVAPGDHGLSEEERREIEIEVRQALKETAAARAEAKLAIAEARVDIEEALAEARAEAGKAHQLVMIETKDAKNGRTVVKMSCEDKGKNGIAKKKTKDGTHVMMICESDVMAQALAGLEEARAALAKDPGLDAETREEVLRSLDAEIKRFRAKEAAAG